ncbi:hypothetical protein F3Y22_tig00110783pilonHSYRG00207 [Hibiscus syriacus]|uniref:Uncharacterized protein n=1 Tax=Hibiscus syriacus TaxID=106335 RepID=A0A6A2ZR66_HIBSY|nr:hypothetical protein F3Y22_tig00110783pilonHSYRG00207 [Hibiscus syriacus]
METWFLIISSLCLTAILKALFNLVFPSTSSKEVGPKLPPGPAVFPLIGNALWLRKSFSNSNQSSKASTPSSGAWSLSTSVPAHQYFNQHTIGSASYGQTWRALRKNITSEILNHSRIRSYSHCRKWVLNIVKDRLIESGTGCEPVRVVDHFRYAMFSLLVLMCFGDKLNENQIREIEDVQRELQSNIVNFNIFNVWPRVTKEKRGLTEREMVSLCSEFLNAGTDTTYTTLQWIMANLVKYPEIQDKLFTEMKGVVGEGDKELIEEEDCKDALLESCGFGRIGPEALGRPNGVKPERFVNGSEAVDLTGSKEIKMMPFGAGRRVCPGIGLATLHLEYFVANLVWSFRWEAADGNDVDMSEKTMFTTTMKTPLQGRTSMVLGVSQATPHPGADLHGVRGISGNPSTSVTPNTSVTPQKCHPGALATLEFLSWVRLCP